MAAEESRSAHDGFVTDGDVEFGFRCDGAFEVRYLAGTEYGGIDGGECTGPTDETSL